MIQMAIRLSQAFAAHRTSVIALLQDNLVKELVPNFNSEVEDIRREHDTMKGESGEALADHRKRSRIMDLKVRQQEFISGLDKELEETLTKRVVDYGGKVISKTIASDKGKEKLVLEAEFPDGSTARVPKHLWVDYDQFQRV
jgi:hypothetical protein